MRNEFIKEINFLYKINHIVYIIYNKKGGALMKETKNIILDEINALELDFVCVFGYCEKISEEKNIEVNNILCIKDNKYYDIIIKNTYNIGESDILKTEYKLSITDNFKDFNLKQYLSENKYPFAYLTKQQKKHKKIIPIKIEITADYISFDLFKFVENEIVIEKTDLTNLSIKDLIQYIEQIDKNTME